MPQISMKKLAVVILIVILLAHLDVVVELGHDVFRTFSDSFEPLQLCSVESKYVVMLLFLALLYISIFKYLYYKKGD